MRPNLDLEGTALSVPPPAANGIALTNDITRSVALAFFGAAPLPNLYPQAGMAVMQAEGLK